MGMEIIQSIGVELGLVFKGIVSIAEFTATAQLIVSNPNRIGDLTGDLMGGIPSSITQVGGGEMGTGVEIDLVSRDIVLIAEFTAIDQLIVTGQIMVI